MDDDPRYSSSRYLRVPFIFVPDGAPEPPQLAAFTAAHPGAVKFHANLTMSPVGAGATIGAGVESALLDGARVFFQLSVDGFEIGFGVGIIAAGLGLKPEPLDQGEEEALRAWLAAHGDQHGALPFEPPPPSPPLPGLVPPAMPKTKPGEGGFTPLPRSRPPPGFTPSPPSAPVHPGRPAVANKPIIVSHAKKRELRPARADVRGVRRYNPDVPSHALAAAAEAELAQKVHDMPDEHVLDWGQPIGSHGADVTSVNTKTGAVTLWDAKSRSRRVTIGQSSTFTEERPRANAIDEAEKAILRDKTLAPKIRDEALRNLDAGRVRTVTTGFGNVRNSVIGD